MRGGRGRGDDEDELQRDFSQSGGPRDAAAMLCWLQDRYVGLGFLHRFYFLTLPPKSWRVTGFHITHRVRNFFVTCNVSHLFKFTFSM